WRLLDLLETQLEPPF
ncbi:unnamed protein product, partial [Allacma fusca]